VVELPHPFELDDEETRGRIEEWIGANFRSLLAEGEVWAASEGGSRIADEADYQSSFSCAPGTKVGGFPSWIQDADYPSCARGHRMDHLLTIASWEFDDATWWRWLPTEERAVWAGPTRAHLETREVAGLMLGDAGSLYVFVCRLCDTIAASSQSC